MGIKNMKISAHQPAYLPWLGYLDKIKSCDVFVYMDSVQFQKNSFINRNLIKTANGPIWLTIPVKQKGHMSSTMLELQLDNSKLWNRKHLSAIEMNYRKAKRFEEIFPKLEKLYQTQYDLLIDLCWDHLQFWLNELDIKTKIVKLSSMNLTSYKSDLVLDMCKHLHATHYFSGARGIDYLNEESFQKENIVIEYQAYQHVVYPQLYGEFVPNLGVVDYLMNGL